jgi:hypothetical protein
LFKNLGLINGQLNFLCSRMQKGFSSYDTISGLSLLIMSASSIVKL